MKHLEIKTISHKGVDIMVKIDYEKETISLVTKENNSYSKEPYPSKHYIFGGRGVNYMNGWLNVLDAMSFAIKEAKKDLQEHLDEEEKRDMEVMIEVSKAQAKEAENEVKKKRK